MSALRIAIIRHAVLYRTGIAMMSAIFFIDTTTMYTTGSYTLSNLVKRPAQTLWSKSRN
jgi:hypothetical protein